MKPLISIQRTLIIKNKITKKNPLKKDHSNKQNVTLKNQNTLKPKPKPIWECRKYGYWNIDSIIANLKLGQIFLIYFIKKHKMHLQNKTIHKACTCETKFVSESLSLFLNSYLQTICLQINNVIIYIKYITKMNI